MRRRRRRSTTFSASISAAALGGSAAFSATDESLFPDIAHHRLEDGRVTATIPAFHPFASITQTFTHRGQTLTGGVPTCLGSKPRPCHSGRPSHHRRLRHLRDRP